MFGERHGHADPSFSHDQVSQHVMLMYICCIDVIEAPGYISCHILSIVMNVCHHDDHHSHSMFMCVACSYLLTLA